jgi:hypothetical protein
VWLLSKRPLTRGAIRDGEKARYSKHRITGNELGWLGESVERLGRLIEVICSDRIAQLESNRSLMG